MFFSFVFIVYTVFYAMYRSVLTSIKTILYYTYLHNGISYQALITPYGVMRLGKNMVQVLTTYLELEN